MEADTDHGLIAGVEFRAVDSDRTLTVGAAGLRYEQGDHVTSVVWRDIEAVVHVTDEERSLRQGRSAARVQLSDWDEGRDLIGDIDRLQVGHVQSCSLVALGL
ncbi:MAG: hypothetical protein R2706_02890 [Acidimicrobiales bacterium]